MFIAQLHKLQTESKIVLILFNRSIKTEIRNQLNNDKFMQEGTANK